MTNRKFSSFSHANFEKKPMVQKVVIPKEAVNPENTIIIEIPASLQSVPILLAKRAPVHMEELLNARWNRTGVKSFKRNMEFEGNEDLFRWSGSRSEGSKCDRGVDSEHNCLLRKEGSTDATLQTSVTEVETSVQVDPVDSSPNVWKRSSTILQQNAFDWDYFYAPTLTPNKQSVYYSKTNIHPHQKTSNRNMEKKPSGLGVRKSKLILESSKYEWTRHNCNVEQELRDLLNDAEACYGINKHNQTYSRSAEID